MGFEGQEEILSDSEADELDGHLLAHVGFEGGIPAEGGRSGEVGVCKVLELLFVDGAGAEEEVEEDSNLQIGLEEQGNFSPERLDCDSLVFLLEGPELHVHDVSIEVENWVQVEPLPAALLQNVEDPILVGDVVAGVVLVRLRYIEIDSCMLLAG